jgi:PAS domain S-box-containing protein
MKITEDQLIKYLDIAGSFIISLNKNHVITYINKSGAKILEREVEDIIGKDYFELCVAEKERETIRDRFTKLFDKPFLKPNNFEGVVITANGKSRTINWTNTALRDDKGQIVEIISSGNDITWRMHALRKLIESKKKYKALIEATDTGFCILDEDARLMEANPKFLHLIGKDNFDEIDYKCVSEFIALYNRDFFKENIRTCITENRVRHFEVDLEHSDNHIIPVHLSVNRFADHIGTQIIVLCQDITERREKEKAAKQHELQLIQADKMASLGILVSGVAHEINNPNNFVMLNIPILQGMWQHMKPILDDYLNENGDFFVGKRLKYSAVRESVPELMIGIYEGSKRIQTIVKELKDYSRKQDENHFEAININEVVNTAIILTENLIHKSTEKVEYNLEKNIPLINGNFQKLEQVIINLLENSCQAITNKKQKIKINSYYNNKDRTVVCDICDEGMGMDKITLTKIRDPFFTTKRTEGGTGLGLAVSSKIIANHDGKLTFTSEPNVGTCARLSFPVYASEEI